MSITPKLHICSSVPVSGFASRGGEETKSRIPKADSWGRLNQGNHSECWGQLVNLRVPSPITRETEKESSGFVRRLDGHKRILRRRSQNIGRVTVPNILALDQADDSGMDHSDQLDKPNSMGECSNINSVDKYLSFSPEFEEGQEFDWIPSVKPWTEEELRELKNKYSLMEDEVKKESERKKRKQRALVRGSDVSCLALDKYKCFKQHKNSENKGLNVSISHDNRVNRTLLRKSPLTVASQQKAPVKAKFSGKQFHETKLAEIYMIQLGINP